LWRLWPNLKELRIISACSHIDEVLTGIPSAVWRKILLQRPIACDTKSEAFPPFCPELEPYLNKSVPSIRNLKNLRRLEINSRMTPKLRSLTCLPSDVSVFYGFMMLPELRSVVIPRSLISPEATFQLQRHVSSFGTVQVEQIEFEFDETIDAFQFHRQHQILMKLLCQYGSNRLNAFPGFLTSLWMDSRM